MNEEIKARWITALRDPEAKQIKSALGIDDGGRCCLGVLCDIAVMDGVIDPPVQAEKGDLWYYAGKCTVLPEEVIEWAGLENENPQLGAHIASLWNDDYEKNFFEIALLIEEHL